MGVEIERKFLVNKEKWKFVEKPYCQFLRQGYLVTDPEKTIRVRQTPTHGFLTIKGKSVGAKRTEFEYEIPLEEAKELLDGFAVTELSKTRYEIIVDGRTWEIDEFHGTNEGLIVAEIELLSEDEKFQIPDWVESEVTGELKYYNSNLATNPFQDWADTK